jgi:hypothetical protein
VSLSILLNDLQAGQWRGRWSQNLRKLAKETSHKGRENPAPTLDGTLVGAGFPRPLRRFCQSLNLFHEARRVIVGWVERSEVLVAKDSVGQWRGRWSQNLRQLAKETSHKGQGNPAPTLDGTLVGAGFPRPLRRFCQSLNLFHEARRVIVGWVERSEVLVAKDCVGQWRGRWSQNLRQLAKETSHKGRENPAPTLDGTLVGAGFPRPLRRFCQSLNLPNEARRVVVGWVERSEVLGAKDFVEQWRGRWSQNLRKLAKETSHKGRENPAPTLDGTLVGAGFPRPFRRFCQSLNLFHEARRVIVGWVERSEVLVAKDCVGQWRGRWSQNLRQLAKETSHKGRENPAPTLDGTLVGAGFPRPFRRFCQSLNLFHEARRVIVGWVERSEVLGAKDCVGQWRGRWSQNLRQLAKETSHKGRENPAPTLDGTLVGAGFPRPLRRFCQSFNLPNEARRVVVGWVERSENPT